MSKEYDVPKKILDQEVNEVKIDFKLNDSSKFKNDALPTEGKTLFEKIEKGEAKNSFSLYCGDKKEADKNQAVGPDGYYPTITS